MERRHLTRSFRSHCDRGVPQQPQVQRCAVAQRACYAANRSTNQSRPITLARPSSSSRCRTLHTSRYLLALQRRPGPKQSALSVTDSYDAERVKAEGVQRKKDEEKARFEASRRKVDAERKEEARARLAAEQLAIRRQNEQQAARLSVAIVKNSWPEWQLASAALNGTPPAIRDMVISRTRSVWEARYESTYVAPLDRLWTGLGRYEGQLPSTRAAIVRILKSDQITAIQALLDRSGAEIKRYHNLYNDIVDELRLFDTTLLRSALSWEDEWVDKKGVDGLHDGTDKALSDLFVDYNTAAMNTQAAYDQFILLLSARSVAKPRWQQSIQMATRWQGQRHALLRLLYEMGGHLHSARACGAEAHEYRAFTSLKLFSGDEGRSHIFRSKVAYHALDSLLTRLRESAMDALSIIQEQGPIRQKCIGLGFEAPPQVRNQHTELYASFRLMASVTETLEDDTLLQCTRGLSQTLMPKTDLWDRALIATISYITHVPSATMALVKDLHDFSAEALKRVTCDKSRLHRVELLNQLDSILVGIRQQERRILRATDHAQLWTGVRQMVCGLSLHEAHSARSTIPREGGESASDAFGGVETSQSSRIIAQAMQSSPVTMPQQRIAVEYITTSPGAFYACLEIARESVLGVDVIVARRHTALAEQFLVLSGDDKVWIFWLNRRYLDAPFRSGSDKNPLAQILIDEKIYKLCANVADLRQHLFVSYAFEMNGAMSTQQPHDIISTSGNMQIPDPQPLDYQELFTQLLLRGGDYVDALHTIAGRAYRNFRIQKAFLSNVAQNHTAGPDDVSRSACTKNESVHLAASPDQARFEFGPFRLDPQHGYSWSRGSLPYVPNEQKRTRDTFLRRASEAWAANALKQRKELFDLKTKSDRVKLGPTYMRALQAYFLYVKMDEDAQTVKAIVSVKRLYEVVTTIAKKADLPMDEMQLASLRQDAIIRGEILSSEIPMPQAKQIEAFVLDQVDFQTQVYLRQCQTLREQLRLRDEFVRRSTLKAWVLCISNRYGLRRSSKRLGMSTAQVAADLVSSYAFLRANGTPIQHFELERFISTLSAFTGSRWVPGMQVLHSDPTVLNEDGTFGIKRSATPGSEESRDSETARGPTTKALRPPSISYGSPQMGVKAPPKATGSLLAQGVDWLRNAASSLQVEGPSKMHDPPPAVTRGTPLGLSEVSTPRHHCGYASNPEPVCIRNVSSCTKTEGYAEHEVTHTTYQQYPAHCRHGSQPCLVKTCWSTSRTSEPSRRIEVGHSQNHEPRERPMVISIDFGIVQYMF